MPKHYAVELKPYSAVYPLYLSKTARKKKTTWGVESECSVGRVSVGEDDSSGAGW